MAVGAGGGVAVGAGCGVEVGAGAGVEVGAGRGGEVGAGGGARTANCAEILGVLNSAPSRAMLTHTLYVPGWAGAISVSTNCTCLPGTTVLLSRLTERSRGQ